MVAPRALASVESTPVFDLDAVIREGDERKPFPFTFDSQTFELPPDLDLRVLRQMNVGNLDGSLAMMLGAEQWERLLATDKAFTLSHFFALLKRYGDYLGVSLGESSAPTGSSNGTAKRSRPTSSGTTKSRSRN